MHFFSSVAAFYDFCHFVSSSHKAVDAGFSEKAKSPHMLRVWAGQINQSVMSKKNKALFISRISLTSENLSEATTQFYCHFSSSLSQPANHAGVLNSFERRHP